MTSFLERQRAQDDHPSLISPSPEDDDGVDHSLAHLTLGFSKSDQSKKGRVQQVDWDDSFAEMSREKAAAEATRGRVQSNSPATLPYPCC